MMKMRFLLYGIVLFFSTTALSLAADIDLSTGINYDGWHTDENEGGYQVYLPLQIGTVYQRLFIQLLTGYAYTCADYDGTSGKVDGVLDTKVNLAYEQPRLLSLDWLIGLDFNLPTGKTGVNEKDLIGLWDSDLVSLTRVGEGFNVNPTLSAAKSWNNWTAGLGLGYAFRGEYDYSDQIEAYDPGDIFNIAGEVNYDFSSQWRGRFFAEYATFGKDRVDGEDFAQEGDFWLLGLGFSHVQTQWDVSATIQGIFRDKSRFQQGSNGIRTEQRNSHGDEWIVDLFYRYYLEKRTALTTQFQYLFVDENSYDDSESYYIGQRQKGTLALGIQHQWTPSVDASFQLKGFLMNDEENWRHPGEERKYTGYALYMSLTTRF